MLWSMVSKAFFISKNTEKFVPFLSMLIGELLEQSINAKALSAMIGTPNGDYPKFHFVAEIQVTDYSFSKILAIAEIIEIGL